MSKKSTLREKLSKYSKLELITMLLITILLASVFAVLGYYGGELFGRFLYNVTH